MMSVRKVLIVEDDDLMQGMLEDALKGKGYSILITGTGPEAWGKFQDSSFDIVLADYKLPGMDGIELLKRIKKISPETIVIIMTAYGTVESAVEAMKFGAYDFITKPFLSEELNHLIEKGFELQNLKLENKLLRQELDQKFSLGNIIGKSKSMQEVYRLIEVVAGTDSTVLIQGESGTGKELIAEAIHHLSERKEKPLIKVSCAALPETLLESELFGHEKGAFTGAASRKTGRFELAHRGTIFLDDVDDLHPGIQVKLLRVLQEKQFERVGGTNTLNVDVRVLSASKTNLKELVNKGQFRDDLFYRLNVVPVNLPPLRQRAEDVPLLLTHFVQQFNQRLKKHIVLSPAALQELINYEWPGNIRELENLIERLITVTTKKRIEPEDLPILTRQNVNRPSESLKSVVIEAESEHIRNVLASTGGKKKEAAKILNITPKTLWQKMKMYNIE